VNVASTGAVGIGAAVGNGSARAAGDGAGLVGAAGGTQV
jgi:hypothetical protein